MLLRTNPSWKLESTLRQDSPAANTDSTEKPVRILMTGSRDWSERRAIGGALKRALLFTEATPAQAVLVHGDARGADRLTAALAERLGMSTEAHPADWSTHSKDCPSEQPAGNSCWRGRSSCRRAGFRRNKEMVDAGASVLLAFIRDSSPGASGLLKLWLAKSQPVVLCEQSGAGPVSGSFLHMECWLKPGADSSFKS